MQIFFFFFNLEYRNVNDPLKILEILEILEHANQHSMNGERTATSLGLCFQN